MRRIPSSSRYARLLAILPVGALVGSLFGLGATGALADPVSPATTYYVDCSATVNGVGTSTGSPWNSTAAVNAHGGFAPGDKILFRPGTTCKGRLTPSGSGTPGNPIVLGKYPTSGSRPTIAGGGTPNNTATVELVNVHDWTVQDVHLTNAGSTKQTRVYRSGLLFLNTGVGMLANVTAQRLTVNNVYSNPGNGNTRAYGGISALTFGTSGSGFSNLKILNSQISNVSRTGIVVSNAEYPRGADTNVQISKNTVRSARGDSIVMIGVTGGRIDHNLSANGGKLGSCSWCGRYGGPSTASAGIWPAASSNITIDHNEVYGENAKAGDGEAFDVDVSAKNVTIEQNYAHDNQGGGVMFCGAQSTTVRYNIFQNNGKAAITFTCAQHAKDIKIYNNDIYVAKRITSATAVVRNLHGFGGSGLQFKNNIVYSYGPSHYTWPSKVTAASNTFIGTHTSKQPSGPGTLNYTKPNLKKVGSGKTGFGSVNGYRLKSTKSAQHGVAVSGTATTDFFGHKVNLKKPYRGAANGT